MKKRNLSFIITLVFSLCFTSCIAFGESDSINNSQSSFSTPLGNLSELSSNTSEESNPSFENSSRDDSTIVEIPENGEIATAEQFMLLDGATGEYTLVNDIDFFDYPFFTGLSSFSGVFNGQGYSLKNIMFSENYSAVFGTLEGGIVKNVMFENIVVYGEYCAGVSYDNGSVENCFVQISFEEGASGAGVLYNLSSDEFIKNCIVEISSKNNNSQLEITGGIIRSSFWGTIIDCYVLTYSENMYAWTGIWGNGNGNGNTHCYQKGEYLGVLMNCWQTAFTYSDRQLMGKAIDFSVYTGNMKTKLQNKYL